MNITPASLQSQFIGFNTIFQAAMASVQPSVDMLATRVPSNGEGNVYAHMTKLLAMRKWIGDRQIQNIGAKSYQLNNEPFELTVAVERKKMADDQLGVYTGLIQEMGRQTALWLDDMTIAALQEGSSSSLASSMYDGVPFFSTAHPIDLDGRIAGTQSNLLTAATLDETGYIAARVALTSLVGSDGRPLGCRMTHIVVPPQLEVAARKIVAAEYGSNGSSNVLQGTAQVIVLPMLASEPAVWYAMDLSRSIKPLIAQVREAPDFVSLTDPSSDGVFMRDEYIYGSKARGAAGYGLWFLAVRNSPTGT